mmetsp:Transcript_11856/g.28447  ORF Transcript_11856/g.28447 Transcript_11856/m.28447 type:complete len:81 (-) Transcript_11856:788-1030(-)
MIFLDDKMQHKRSSSSSFHFIVVDYGNIYSIERVKTKLSGDGEKQSHLMAVTVMRKRIFMVNGAFHRQTWLTNPSSETTY